MTRFGWIVTTIIILLSAAILLLVVVLTSHRSAQTPVTAASTSVPLVDPTTLSIYTSGTYGFSFFYPALAAVTDEFSTTTNDGISWRENPIATGTLIARVSIDAGDVRIGTSKAPKELSSCTKSGPAEQAQADTTIGSTTWKTFSFDKLGTDVEQHVTSYRTVHDNACFALEVFALRSGASTTQSALNSIVETFSFAKP